LSICSRLRRSARWRDTPATGGTVQLNSNTLTTGGDDTGTAFAGQITGTGGLI
jgi:hypothetical protein